MESDDRPNLKKLASNKFVLGMITGFLIATITKKLFVGIVLLVVIGLVWYGASRKKKDPVEEEV